MSELLTSRRRTVDAAREAWIRRLVDTSRRNNLLYFRDLRVGTLDFGGAREGAVEELLMGARVPLSALVPGDPKATDRLREIVRKALSNREERGLETLYLAYGMATWPVEDGGRAPEAAAVLIPIAVEGRSTPMLFRSGPPRPNLALLHALADLGFEPPVDEDDEDATTMIARLAAAVPLEGFAVRPRAVVGNFSFQKLAMVRDLRDEADAMAAHDLVASLAGDPSARAEIAQRRVDVDPRSLDDVSPDDEFMPLDADSSQQAVVHAVARGSDGVVQGPPGCGKSQTIANLVATLVAQGKRVLFVAEKRAALEAVHKRLEATGLGGLALDLHGATISQRAVVARIGDALAGIREAVEPDDDALHARFVERRTKLAAHDRLMHAPLAPTGRSPYGLQAALVASKLVTKTRWRGAELARLDVATADRIAELFDEAAGHEETFLRKGPWANANLVDGASVQAALDAASSLAEILPEMRQASEAWAVELGIPTPVSVASVEGLLELVDRTNERLTDFDLTLFGEAAELLADLRPMDESPLSLFWATLSNARYRRARRRLRELSKLSKPRLDDVAQIAGLAEAWRKRGMSARPVARPGEFDRFWRSLQEATALLDRALPATPIRTDADPQSRVRELLAASASARAIPSVRGIEAELESLGASRILDEIRSEPSSVSGDRWASFFRDAWVRSAYDAALAQNAALAGFSGESHDALAAEFRALDRARTELAAVRVRRAHAEAAVRAMNAFPEQTDRVRSEAQKRSRHKPLRRLLSEAPDVLTAVLPCWMTSPLNVSGLLPAETLFDVVVFDEASQVLPEDAVGAVLRGRRLVVAGDRHQLPPTIFFADGGGEEAVSEVAGFQSLLDGVGGFMEPWPLLWHYRSRDERLIAFSNRFVYGDRLVTFPGVGGEPCVDHVLVGPSDPSSNPEEESPSTEVAKVVELILEHATRSPDLSLGVIAMGLKHAARIEAALDHALDARPELGPFFDPSRPERFFVKNLEAVQGDERDAILLSIGYGKGADGRLPYRFGPLLQDGGERRLNVAITRARRRMTVVSSFSPLDMEPGRSKAKGVVLLREFLQFAASGGAGLGRPEEAPESDALLADLRDALEGRGVPTVAGLGASSSRLDLAAERPGGEYVLAVESDGAAYHAAPTVRDRDRLRSQQLEAIGWRHHRVWSTDWTLHRERELDDVVAAWNAAQEVEISVEAASEPVVALDVERPDPPIVARRDDVEDVPPADLDALVRWVVGDGVKTDDEIVDEVADRLGYARVGTKIERTVRASLARVRSQVPLS